MGWRKILNTVLYQLAVYLLKMAFNWLDVNKDGGLQKKEITQRVKELQAIIQK